MTPWTPKFGAFLCACLFISTASQASSPDSVAYSGIWTSQSPALTLKIDGNHADLTVNNHPQTDTTLQYLQNQLPTAAPFLYLDARDDSGKQEHQLYLIASTDIHEQPCLNGHYDRITLNAKGEKVATETFPLNLEQPQQHASAN